ncbi:hypothetical protein ACPZ19_50185 [Amycolatopsis lurida]
MSGTDGRVAWRVAFSSLAEAVSAAATVAALVVVVEICRRLLGGSMDSSTLTGLTTTAVAVVLAGAFVQFAARVLSRRAGALYRKSLRDGVLQRLRDGRASTPADWRATGATFESDVVLAGTVVGRSVPEAVTNLMVFLLSVGYLFWVDWRMALVSLLPLLLGFAVFGVIAAKFERDMRTDYDAAENAINAARPVVDLRSRIHPAGARADRATVVRAAAHELAGVVDRFAVYFRDKVGDLFSGRALAEIAFSPLTALVIILVGGGLLVQADALPPADLVPFLTVGAGLSAPLLTLSYLAEEFGVGKKAGSGLKAFAAGPASEKETPIELPARGVVTVGDEDLVAAERAIVRIISATPPDRLAAVLLDPPVITGPIGDFIIAGDASAAERAARIADVHDLIASLPRGYAAEAGAEVSLSLRESRRLALAKAVAGDHDVVLIDGRVFTDDVAVLCAAVDELAPRTAVVCVAPPPAFSGGRAVVLDAVPSVPEEAVR